MAIGDRGVFQLLDKGDRVLKCDYFLIELREDTITETAWRVVVTELTLHSHEELVETFTEQFSIEFHPKHRGIFLDGVLDLTVEVIQRLQLFVFHVDCHQLGEIGDVQIEKFLCQD
jgi:hypothetical protein